MVKVLVPLAEGFEEIEATAVIDVLRRAGIEVVTAGIPGTFVDGSRKMRIAADRKIDEINPDDFNALVLVGGNPGYLNLGKTQKVISAIKDFNGKNKLIAAICGAPTILAKAGVLENKKATVFPGMERQLPYPRNGRVIVDGNIVTSQGPGTAIEFALKLVEILAGKAKADEIKGHLVC